MALTNGPTKGLVVLTCPDMAESAVMKLEPIELTEAQYNDVLAGSSTLTVTVHEDTDEHKYAEAVLTPA